MTTAILILAGYLAGSLPFGYWLVRLFKHVDIRTVGSGNIGATNVWRTYGRWYGVPVVLLDVLKGFVPAFVGTMLVSHWAGVLAGGAAMLGHARPLFLKFARGGKMVATCGGVFFGVAPLVAVAGLVGWLLLFLLTRYASVASILTALALGPIAYGLGEPLAVDVLGAAAGFAVLVLHRGNIKRLFAGTEHRFELRRRRAGSLPARG
jgi:acyl phosphate:glycerol-3-phosphate acyltransferase